MNMDDLDVESYAVTYSRRPECSTRAGLDVSFGMGVKTSASKARVVGSLVATMELSLTHNTSLISSVIASCTVVCV